jgi:hypothetical protein
VDVAFLTLLGLIALGLLFDCTNGFHDAANSIATAVATPSGRPCRPSGSPEEAEAAAREQDRSRQPL